MKTQTKNSQDPDIANSKKAIQRAARVAQERARWHGHGVIIYKDGHLVKWLPKTGAEAMTSEDAHHNQTGRS
jgi:hypothetical protein